MVLNKEKLFKKQPGKALKTSIVQDIRQSHNTIKIIKGRQTTKAAHGSSSYEFYNDGSIVKKKPKAEEKKHITKSDKAISANASTAHACPLCATLAPQSCPQCAAPEPTPEQHAAFKRQNSKAKKEKTSAKVRSYKLPKSKVRKKIAVWLETKRSRQQVYFWTVTFPAKLADDLCYKYFNVWFTRCRKELHLKSYIWVAERQKNGTLHFHILFNQKINIQRANEFLRITLLNARNKKEFNYDRAKILNYNGVDIAKETSKCYNNKKGQWEKRKGKKALNFAHKSKKKALTKYLTKYITKNETEFTRLVWHNSRDVSALFTDLAITPEQYSNLKQYTVSEWGEIIELENEYVLLNVLMRPPPQDSLKWLHRVNNYIIDNYFNKWKS